MWPLLLLPALPLAPLLPLPLPVTFLLFPMRILLLLLLLLLPPFAWVIDILICVFTGTSTLEFPILTSMSLILSSRLLISM